MGRGSISPQGSGYQEVLEPAFGVAFFVEHFRRTPYSSPLFDGPGIPGGEVVNQRPAPDRQLGGFRASMKVLGAEEAAVHPPHQSVDHVAGSKRARMIVGGGVIGFSAMQLHYRVSDGVGSVLLLAPIDKPPDSLRKRLLGFGGPTFPKLGCGLHENGPMLFLRAVPHFDEDVEKTANDGDRGKQGRPRLSRGLPAVNVYGARGIVRFQGFRLGAENSVTFRQRGFAGVFRDGSPEYAMVANRGGDVGLAAFNPGVLFVGAQMFRHVSRDVDGGSDDAVAPDRLLGPEPIHGITAENVGEAPVWDAKFS